MSQNLLQGKRGLVFGVANEKSIAWACAQACAAQGAELAFSYVGEPLEKRVRKLLESDMPDASMFPCDVSKDADITAFFEAVHAKWDSIDFVIHSVAFTHREDLSNPFVATPRSHFALALDISAYSLVAIAREAAKLMSSGGSIMTMTYYGSEKVIPNYNVMGVAKAALEASARYLAADLGPSGIRVNCISAGPVRTLAASAIAGMRDMLDVTEQCAPLRRNVHLDDVAGTAVYLASSLSAGVTGEVLHVDCGYNVLGMYAVMPERRTQGAETGE